MRFSYYLEKLLAALRVNSLVGGMEVSDLALRFSYFDGKAWRVNGVRLEPGIIEAGKINNRQRFLSALSALRGDILSQGDFKNKVNTVVSLSSINIYSQVFSLPIVEGENLDKAMQLNVQMVSPMESSQTYSGWQTVGEDQKSLRLEVLSAFVEKVTVDDLSNALTEEGFVVVAMEPRSLSLARLLREKGADLDTAHPFILLSLDNSGMDFLIIRQGQFYFEYFKLWKEISDEKGKISAPSFEAALIRSLNQVLNFYGQHWPEPISEVVVLATAFTEETERIIKNNFPLGVRNLKLNMNQSVDTEWFISLGCGLRGLVPRRKDKEMSLFGVGAEEGFHRERFSNFASFWRVLIPVAMGLLLVSFFLADFFVVRTRKSLESQLLVDLKQQQITESELLSNDAEEFNRYVSLIGAAQENYFSRGRLLERMVSIMAANGVTPVNLNFQSANAPLTLLGVTRSENQIADFKKALDTDPTFKDVDLPLSSIESSEGGVSFSVTFRLNQ
ncbi:MAG: PilN domain-containing protein [Patescibacteria group bacterium]